MALAADHINELTNGSSQQRMEFVHNRIIAVDDKDAQVWALITDVPKISNKVIAFLLFALNVIVPGLGTIVASCFSEKWSKTLFAVGLFQLMLAYILIGWIFSIYWGWLILKRALEDQEELKSFLDKAGGGAQRSDKLPF
ncbi:hypothetical protein FGO68_gene8798 [Halteria grandinella]|uniref:Uncharacterized protein n=1 Tax=Halteria grandinella TaxID=5974 RepID=A0A8J8NUC6_HALGN|nr:hypothetical protein FGO68_gene8798 [Halteria grandinella]